MAEGAENAMHGRERKAQERRALRLKPHVTGPAPVVSGLAAAATIRESRANVAADIAKSKQRIAKLAADMRAENKQLADLLVIAEVVGVVQVDETRTPDITDAGVDESPVKLTA
jgi:hypothetical protein